MNEIEDFLRRIAKDKLRQFVGDDDDEEIIDAEIVEDQGITYVADAVPEDRAIGTETNLGSVFTGSSHLGAAIEQADDRMDEHLHDVFEHRLGQLEGVPDRAEDVASDAGEQPAQSPRAIDLRSLLRSPQSVRNAIIVSEIIRRPEERW